jgi:hypothetical protein
MAKTSSFAQWMNLGVTIVRARLIAGGGAGAWDNFSGAADALTFTAGETTTTFDFEADSAGNAPEPGTILVVGSGLIGLLKLRQARYRQGASALRRSPDLQRTLAAKALTSSNPPVSAPYTREGSFSILALTVSALRPAVGCGEKTRGPSAGGCPSR